MNQEEWLQFVKKIKIIYDSKFIPLHEPTFNNKEIEYVTDCIESGWVSSVGSYVNKFEEELAKFIGVKRAVAVVNGTAALHIALKVAGVKANDEVLIPSLTFVATANAVSYLNAIPHFIDVSNETMGIDPLKLDDHLKKIGEMHGGHLFNKLTGRHISAVVPMHTFGHSMDIDGILNVCDRYNLMLIEDAAESLGTYYKGKHTASFGKINAISFNGNKIITTGGGGAIVTNDDELADYAKHLTTTAKLHHRWQYEHDEIGYNYRMPNINAALGCAQMEQLPHFIEQKRGLADIYEKLVKQLTGVKLFKEPLHSRSNYWLQTIIIDEQYELEKVLEFLNEQGIMSRPIWTPLHHLPMYKDCPKSDLSVCESLYKKTLNIPSTPITVEENE
ncbi:LegC family aminotransferase [Bacillus sp. Bva_UNVM-123]|uniref:LegC family aminotransferase n=1 Tax=Bacillus sp. Bva_UNVM-123 TaxID=2829798 RepID=UPI00391F2924